ncbi:energy transducer TonB [uncultured Tenacibaculum sp.]|uniref:energy transducer TonB n=1 Tax=uncultured Tenacibaculum sp. TaxID=174713 RepID=UPI002629D34A|nr:energy transducer TonB [uncultured Tenacibaculum sp.]
MKNIIILILVFFTATQIFSQEVCVTKGELIIDVNELNKCEVVKEVDVNKKPNQKDIIISSKRYFKKRTYLSKAVLLATNLKTNSVKDVKVKNDLITQPLLVVEKVRKKETSVSFDSVEKIPMFKNCSDTTLDEFDCFNQEMQKHITENFRYPEKALDRGIEGNLNVSFIIDSYGEIKNVKIIGENVHKILKKEAERIVALLPDFIPGKQNNKSIDVLYEFPIVFSLEE